MGEKVTIHAYKHNGDLYRSGEYAIVLADNSEYLVLVNEDVIVTESNGRKWKTSEPAIGVFNKKSWSNIICMFKDSGLNFYCNIASPYIIDAKTIKYIDYDLDIKVFSDGSYKILDLKEFNRNRITWKYDREIVTEIGNEIDNLKQKIKHKEFIFSRELVRKFGHMYVDYLTDLRDHKIHN